MDIEGANLSVGVNEKEDESKKYAVRVVVYGLYNIEDAYEVCSVLSVALNELDENLEILQIEGPDEKVTFN